MNRFFSKKTHLLFSEIILLCLIFYSYPVRAIETSDPNFTIDNFTLISKKRVSRTDYEFTYKVDLTNFGAVSTGVTAIVTTTSPSSSIMEESLNFDDMLNGTTVTSTDTFTIRHNRRTLFDPNSLTFNINATVHHDLPPHPSDEGKLTIEGIDSDDDGVRDDVQIALTLIYPIDNEAKSALTQFAKTLQQGFIKQSNDTPQPLDDIFADIIKATDCISHFSSKPKEDVVFIEMLMGNTDERNNVYLEINAAASGRFFGGEFNPETDCDI